MRYYKGFLLWGRIKRNDGEWYIPDHGDDFWRVVNQYWYYITVSRNKDKWMFGMYRILFDCQGHEALHLGPFCISWSTSGSYKRCK